MERHVGGLLQPTDLACHAPVECHRPTVQQRAQLSRESFHLVDTSRGPSLAAVADVQKERAKTLKEMAANSVFFYVAPTQYEEKAAKKNLNAETKPQLEKVLAGLAALEDFTAPAIHTLLQGIAEAGSLNLGKVAQPVRVAIAGGGVSPPIDQTLALLGREEVLARLERALSVVGG